MDAALAPVRETLLRNPSLINSHAMAVRLLSAREKCSTAEAQILIRDLRTANVYVELFKTVMPEEFKLDSGSRGAIAQRFANALGFPIDDFAIPEWSLQGEDPLLRGIPIESMAIHMCGECFQFAALPLIFQLPILLFTSEELMDIDLIYAEDGTSYQEELDARWELFSGEHRIPDRLRPVGDYNKRLRTLFEKQRSPLRVLPLMQDAISYSTGCVFFDFAGDDQPPELKWSTENIKWLRAQFKLVNQINADLKSLDNWLHEKPHKQTRIMKALRLHQQAQRPTNDKERRRRVANGKRGTLARIL